MGILPAVLQFAFAHGDDDRKKEYEQAQEWEKDTYWIFGGVKIPKGLDVGIRLMANLTDEALGAMYDEKPVNVKRAILDPIVKATPSITATVFTPAIEAWGNYSFFRDAPIVPRGEENLPKRLQYDTSTSTVSKIFGDLTDNSPRKVDYLINGYLGYLGRFTSHIPNYYERGMGLEDLPMIRRFSFEPYKNPQIVKDYYEAYNRQQELYNGYKLEWQQGKKVDLPEDYDPALHKRLRAAQEPMRKISRQEKLILEDPKLSYEERKAKIRELEKRRVALCEKVFKRAH